MPEGFEDFDPHEETRHILADDELMESLRVSRAEAADRLVLVHRVKYRRDVHH